MKKFLLILLFIPLLSNCTQYTAMVGPSLTFAQTGSVFYKPQLLYQVH